MSLPVHLGLGVELDGHLEPGVRESAVKVLGELLQTQTGAVEAFGVGEVVFGALGQD